MRLRNSFLLLPHLRWWGNITQTYRRLTWWRPWLSRPTLTRQLPWQEAQTILRREATATLTRKMVFPSTPMSRAHASHASSNSHPSMPLQSRGALSKKAHGSARSRPNCVGSGCKAFNVRTSSKSRDADSHMDKKNCRRKRHSADNTSHRFVRISWNIQVSARMAPDAFSSTLLKTWK